MELEDLKNLRARSRKFLNLTNERKKMSKTTLRKRLSLTVTTALLAGFLTVASAPVASASHSAAGSTVNTNAGNGTINGSLFVATVSSDSTTGAVTASYTSTAIATSDTASTSKGLLSKDTSSGTAQTATVLAGGQLSLYARVSTAAAFSASGGSFSSTTTHLSSISATYNSSNTATLPGGYTQTNISATGTTAVATLWTAPTTVGTYTVSLLTGFVAQTDGDYEFPTTSSLPPTLSGQITVSVVAASAGGSYSAAYSACNTNTFTRAAVASTTAPYPNNIDSADSVANGGAWYIDFDLNDAYNANLDPGNIVVTATNNALVNIGTTAGATPVAGTSSTDVEFANGVSDTVIVTQGTAGAPVTTTVTITYNGTTVCTKTVTIRGEVAKLTVANVGTQKLSGLATAGSTYWMYSQLGINNSALFTVQATDSAGNLVSTTADLGTFSGDPATLTTTVQALSVNTRSNSTSSSADGRFNFGSWQCGADAGQASVKLRFTTTTTGKTVVSDAFTARCAGDPYTFTASLDKASYTQGEVATVSVQFLDSKGNKANNVTAPGASSFTLPQMTSIDWASSALAVTKADGSTSYKYTTGKDAGLTAGTWTGTISYTSLLAAATATPTYKVATGGDTTSNADVLKSIVALIASINKQIQALQKLILKR
jgi:hypothetical protein